MYDLFCPFNPNQINATPLYVASQMGHHDIVQVLLGAYAHVNIARLDVSDVILNYFMTCGRRKCMHCCIHIICAVGMEQNMKPFQLLLLEVYTLTHKEKNAYL